MSARKKSADPNPINPSHYRGKAMQPADVIDEYFATDGHLSQACKYMLRAGRKPGSSYVMDLSKALWWIARAILLRGGMIDLPPQTKKWMISIDGAPIYKRRTKS